MSGDWQTTLSGPERNRYMLDQEVLSDVVFLVSNNTANNRLSHDQDDEHEELPNLRLRSKKVKRDNFTVTDASSSNNNDCRAPIKIMAHKYMLVSNSPVFYAMFCGMLAEKGEVRVEDVDPDAFREMLSYIYTEHADINLDNVFSVLYVARKYLLLGLIEICEKFFKTSLKSSNAVVLYNQCLQYNEESLAVDCSHKIMFQTAAALSETSACDITFETLSHIMDFQLIKVKEVEMFKFCIKWGKAECLRRNIESNAINLKSVLGNIIWKISYAKMTSGNIADTVMPTGVLSHKVIAEIYQCLCSENAIKMPNFMSNISREIDLNQHQGCVYTCPKVEYIKVTTISFEASIEVQVPLLLKDIILQQPAGKSESWSKCVVDCKKDGLQIDSVEMCSFSDDGNQMPVVHFDNLPFLPGNHKLIFNIVMRDSNGQNKSRKLGFSSNNIINRWWIVPVPSELKLLQFTVGAIKLGGEDASNKFLNILGARLEFHPLLLK